jgi:hypothetical protein
MNNFERKTDPIKTLDIGNTRTLRKGDEFYVTLPYLICDAPGDGMGYTHKCIAVKDEKLLFKMEIGGLKIPQLIDSTNRDRLSQVPQYREVEFYLDGNGYGTAHFDNDLGIWKIEETAVIR